MVPWPLKKSSLNSPVYFLPSGYTKVPVPSLQSIVMHLAKLKLHQNGKILILSLAPKNNEIPCFKLMKQKLNRGLKRDAIMLKSLSRILKNYKIDKFKFNVSITRKKYIQMLKQKYISCLINLTKKQISKGIAEIKNNYSNKISFKDTLICYKYTKHR